MSMQEKKKEKKYIRRSGAKIMASLVVLLGSLSYIMILAVINGSLLPPFAGNSGTDKLKIPMIKLRCMRR